MKAAFVCTGNAFTPSMLYKDNYFIKAAVKSGFETLVIASQYEYIDGRFTKVPPCEISIDGYTLHRLPYRSILGNEKLTEKVRDATGLTDQLTRFAPDFIFYNCPQIYNITELNKIKRLLPSTKIVLDFSTKYINSAKNIISKHILHRGFYRHWLKKAYPYVDLISYVSPETKEFIINEYRLDTSKMIEIGLPAEVINEHDHKQNREEIRRLYNIAEDDILFVHSGKMGKLKRTIELLQSFGRINNPKFKLIIAGSIDSDIKNEVEYLISCDSRVNYIGFVSGDYLTKLLCACDMYLQPGTISQTSQTAICCSSPIMFMRCPTNEELFNGNGYIIDHVNEMDTVLESINQNPIQLEQMRKKAHEVAVERLDYINLFNKTLEASGFKVDTYDMLFKERG